MKECMKARPNPTAKFNYAWALIRSKEVSCIHCVEGKRLEATEAPRERGREQ